MTTQANLSALRSLWMVPVALLAAAVLFGLSIWLTVDKARIMPATPGRVVEIYHFLKNTSAAESRRNVYFLGSSVVIAGIDAGIVDESLQEGWNSYNIAWTGGNARQWLLIAPELRRLRPAAVVLALDLAGAARTRPIPQDLAAAARWWSFLKQEDIARYAAVLEPDTLAQLRQPQLAALPELRVYLPGFVDGYFREVARSSLRFEGYTTNFKAPWVRRTVVSDEAMTRQTEGWVNNMRAVGAADRALAVEVLRVIVDDLLAPETELIIVLAPVHPTLRAQLDPDFFAANYDAAKQAVGDRDVTIWDYTTILDAEMFADPVHPFADGREQWSRRLGKDLATLLGEQ